VNDVSFSADGRHLALAGRDGAVRVFQMPGGTEVAGMAHTVSANGVAFSPDGKYLATTSDDRTARVWVVAPDDLLGEACGLVARNLALEEWRQYLRDEPYRKTCPDLP
jgi:WD40 repeat protein